MSTAPAKFHFDLDLGHRQERNTVLTDSALAKLISAARAEGRQEGLAEGQRTVNAEAAVRLGEAASRLADQVASFAEAIDSHRHEVLSEAVEVAASIGRKLAHHLLAADPTAELDALLTECLAGLDAVPHLVLRCAPSLADAVREIALARIAASGFAGRLIVLGEEGYGLDDVKIEWADGGLVRDRALLEAEIDRRVQTYLAARRGHHSGGHR